MNNKIENISQSKENVEKILNTLEKVSIFLFQFKKCSENKNFDKVGCKLELIRAYI